MKSGFAATARTRARALVGRPTAAVARTKSKNLTSARRRLVRSKPDASPTFRPRSALWTDSKLVDCTKGAHAHGPARVPGTVRKPCTGYRAATLLNYFEFAWVFFHESHRLGRAMCNAQSGHASRRLAKVMLQHYQVPKCPMSAKVFIFIASPDAPWPTNRRPRAYYKYALPNLVGEILLSKRQSRIPLEPHDPDSV